MTEQRATTTRRLRRGQLALAVLSMTTLILTGLAWQEYRWLSDLSSDALGSSPKSQAGMNILLIGLDSRKDQDGNPLPPQIMSKLHAGDSDDGGYNTNTLILMHIPADGSRAVAFSIPRDDLVDIPGYHPDKIKKAYGYAKATAVSQLLQQGITDRHQLEARSREAGRRATLNVVRTLTGVPIDHFAEVSLVGFYHTASALGRVEVCLNGPVHDDDSGANFPAGRQWLNAEQALSFVRQRHNLPAGDLDRTHRQQAFLAGVSAQLHGAGVFADPFKLQALLDTARKDIVVDSGWDLLGFAQQMQDRAGQDMEFKTLPIESFAELGGEDVNLIDPGKIRDIVRSAFGVRPPVRSVVDVLNANGGPGVAGRATQRLVAAHLPIGTVADAPELRDDAQVRYNPDSLETARRVADILGGLPVQEDTTLPPGRIQVLLGTNYPANFPATSTGQRVAAQAPPPPPGLEGRPVTGDIPCVN